MGPLGDVLRQAKVIVCVGSGGVGKTTVAAGLALGGVAQGRRVVVCTIDPAKRLANALGLSSLGNVAAQIDPKDLEAAGVPNGSELYAMMLDLKQSWDDFVTRYLPADVHESVLGSRFYQALSTAMAGSQEYIAMEKLYELHSCGDYDLVILDTPPTTHALDFLEAPKRVLDLLGNDAARKLLQPALSAGKAGMSLFQLGSNYVTKTISRLTGLETLQELATFMIQIRGMYDVTKDRAASVQSLLRSKDAAFVLVTSPGALTIDEAIYFHDLLEKEGMPVAAVAANRVHRDYLGDHAMPDAASLAESIRHAGLSDDVSQGFAVRLRDATREAQTLHEVDNEHLRRLEESVAPTPVLRIPRFEKDVYDLPDLWELDQYLFSTEPDTRSSS